MGFADKEIQRMEAERRAREHSDELLAKKGRLIDEIGPKFFAKVKSYVDAEIKKLNTAVRRPSEQMCFLPDSSVAHEGDLQSKIPSFDLYNREGRSPHVYVKYSHPQRAILWQCGSREGAYRVHEDGYVIGADGQAKTPEEVGDELLSIARNAESAPRSTFI